MKILFVADGLFDTDNYPAISRGASAQTWGLSKELARRGHKVSIVRRFDNNAQRKVDNVNLISIRVKDNVVEHMPFLSHLARNFSSMYFSCRGLKSIASSGADVVCLTNRFSGIVPSSLKMRKVYIMHSPDALNSYKANSIQSNHLNSLMFYLKRTAENWLVKKSDAIVALNSFMCNCLLAEGHSKVVNIPNGIDLSEFQAKSSDENFILYAGRFDWNKNVSTLIDVFSKIQKDYPNYRLYLVGQGPEKKRILSRIRSRSLQSRVRVIPWLPRKKLRSFMNRCSLFVLPSFFEVSPNVVLEAMASAKPVIARINIGTVEMVRNGHTGCLYGTNKELEYNLSMLLSDASLRKKMGYNARNVIEQHYTFSAIASAYEQLFDKMLME